MKKCFNRKRVVLLSLCSVTTSIHALSRLGVAHSWAVSSCHNDKPLFKRNERSPVISRRFSSGPTEISADELQVDSDVDFSVKMYGYAIKGRRDYMEDELVISKDQRLAGVFDGHAGDRVSKHIKKRFEPLFVKELTALKVAESPPSNSLPPTADENTNANAPEVTDDIDLNAFVAAETVPSGETIGKVFKTTTKQIDTEVMVVPAMRTVGSTLCSVYINRNDVLSPVDLENVDKSLFPYQIISCNIGDSRAVLSRNGKAIELTTDHKPNHPDEKERIERMGGFVKWDGPVKNGKPVLHLGCYRLNGNLALSRAIGDGYMRPCLTSEPDVVVHEGDWDGDEFVIVATDGLWDEFSSQDAVDFVRGVMAMAAKEEAERKAGKSIDHKLPAEVKKQKEEHEAKVAANKQRVQELLGVHNFALLESGISNHDENSLSQLVTAVESLNLSKQDQAELQQYVTYQRHEASEENSLIHIARANMPKYLTIEAHRQGSTDNISVIVVWLNNRIE